MALRCVPSLGRSLPGPLRGTSVRRGADAELSQYDPGPDGEIRWAINGSSTWTMRASAIGPDDAAQIGQRLVSEEPMVRLSRSTSFQRALLTELGLQSIVLNLAIRCERDPPRDSLACRR